MIIYDIHFLPYNKIELSLIKAYLIILSLSYYQNHMEIRIIVLGDFGVGKTSLLRKLKTNVFDEHIPSSVGFDFFSIRSEKNGRDVIMQFWDTAGQ